METIDILDGKLFVDKQFIPLTAADWLFNYLKTNANWQQLTTGWGKKLPRLTAYYADPGKNYNYSGLTQIADEWTKPILVFKEKVEKAANSKFNSLLLNYYRDGKDSIGWHSDSEDELCPDPIVASLTLGATRNFELKHKNGAKVGRMTIPLTHGMLLIMGPTIQNTWLHAVNKTDEPIGERINLTFRKFK